MTTANRRDFIKTTAATAAAARPAASCSCIRPRKRLRRPSADPLVLELANEALNVARSSGASYADVRDRTLPPPDHSDARAPGGRRSADDESYGLGIRTLVDGCWGFAATSTMTRAGVQNAAREAVTLVARRTHRAAPSGRARAGDARHRHVDDARAARSDRRAARGEDRPAARRQRSRAQSEERPLRQLRASSCCAR